MMFSALHLRVVRINNTACSSCSLWPVLEIKLIVIIFRGPIPPSCLVRGFPIEK